MVWIILLDCTAVGDTYWCKVCDELSGSRSGGADSPSEATILLLETDRGRKAVEDIRVAQDGCSFAIRVCARISEKSLDLARGPAKGPATRRWTSALGRAGLVTTHGEGMDKKDSVLGMGLKGGRGRKRMTSVSDCMGSGLGAVTRSNGGQIGGWEYV